MSTSGKIFLGFSVTTILLCAIIGWLLARVGNLEQAVHPPPKVEQPVQNWIELHGNVTGMGYAPFDTFLTTTKKPLVSEYRTKDGGREWMVSFVEPSAPAPSP